MFLQEGHEELLQQFPSGNAEVLILTEDVFLSAAMTEHPQGVAALVEAPQFTVQAMFPTAPGPAPLVVIAAGLQDPGNLGTLVRSAEAFGATGMILLPGTVSLWNAKTLRASSGSAFRLPVLALTAEAAFTRSARPRGADTRSRSPGWRQRSRSARAQCAADRQ